MTNGVRLTSTAPVVIGQGLQKFGQVCARKDALIINAPKIKALFAKLHAETRLNLLGDLEIGTFVEKAPEANHKLGAWSGNAVDSKFKRAGNNNYRAPNGTQLVSKGKMLLKGKDVKLGYCQLFSEEVTKVSSPSPLDLVSVDFIGNGLLRVVSPLISFNFAGVGKALRQESVSIPQKKKPSTTTVAYDYLLSNPCRLNHLGLIELETERVDFHGTSITAQGVTYYGPSLPSTEITNRVRFIPIPLGAVNYDEKYDERPDKKGSWKATITNTFQGGDQILRHAYQGTNTYVHYYQFLKVFDKQVPDIKNPSVAEIDAFCRHFYEPKIAQAIAKGISGEELFKGWAGYAITPSLTLAEDISLLNAAVHGQTTMSARKMILRANHLDGYNNSVRHAGLLPKAKEIDLQAIAKAQNLGGLDQGLDQDTYSKKLAPEYLPIICQQLEPEESDDSEDKEFVIPRGYQEYPILHFIKTQSWPCLDLVLQAALSEHAGQISYEGLSGKSLVEQVIKQSRAFCQPYHWGKVMQNYIPHGDIIQSSQLLLYYRLPTVESTEVAQLMLHIPASLQNPHRQAGDWVLNDIDVKVNGTGQLSDHRIFLSGQGLIKGVDFEVATTTKPKRTHTTVTMETHAPAEIHLAQDAKLVIEAEEKGTLKGVHSNVASGAHLKVTAKAEVELTPTRMVNEEKIRHGKKKTEHSHLSKVEGKGTYEEQSQLHIHNAPVFATSKNEFKDGKILARTVFDSESQKTNHKKHGVISKKSVRKESQKPVTANLPTYGNKTIFSANSFEGEGVLFSGEVIDETQLMNLRPAIALSIFKMSRNKNWGGITKGMKINQGCECLAESRIEGIFRSRLNPKASAEENILHLTSVIMDNCVQEIEKTELKDIYTPKQWSKVKQTGNFKAVALVSSLIISIYTAGMGGALIGVAENGLTHAVSSAAFSAVCAQATSSMVVNQGDLTKVSKELLSSNTLKNVAVSAGTAGITHSLADKYTFMKSPNGMQDHIFKQVVESAVRHNIDFAISGGSYTGDLSETLKAGAIQGLANALTSQVGDWMSQGKIDYLSKQIMHAAIGASTSKVLGQEAAAGALGAVVGETIAETVWAANADSLNPQASDYHDRIEVLKRPCGDMGKYGAVFAAVIAQCDPEVALSTASRAIEWDLSKRLDNSTSQQKAPSFLNSQVSAIDGVNDIPGYTVEEKVRAVLRATGVSEQDISLVMEDSTVKRAIEDSQNFENQRGCISVKLGDGPWQGCKAQSAEEKADFLKQGLTILTQAATGFNSFAANYPTLTSASLIAIQIAISGPAGYIRDQVVEKIGIQGQIDRVVEASEQWASQTLQSKLNMDETYANVLSSGGSFGLSCGLSAIGAVNKDKILHKAEEVAGKVKVYMTYFKQHPRGGKPYTGRTSGLAEGVEDIDGIEAILRKRDNTHHMNKQGFRPAKMDKASLKPEPIRGQEQFNIDNLGGAQSKGGTSNNVRNGIADNNPKKSIYEAARQEEFGQ